MEKAVFYARVSTEEEAQLRAFPKQVQECKDVISANGWLLVDEYKDEGKSGTQAISRKEYQRLLADIESDKFDIVVAKSQDRLQRNTKDWYIFIDKLIHNNKRLYLYLDGKFFNPSEDALLSGIKAMLAAEYSRDLSKKINNAHQRRIEKARKGETVSAMGTGMCYGYSIVNGMWVVDHEQAKVVKEAYRLYLEYDSIRKVVDKLNEEGYRNQKGGLFCVDSIARILKNPRYKGTQVLNRYHREFDTKKIIENPREEWVVTDDAFEAVVTAAEWDEVNRRLELKKAPNKRGKNVSRHPLGGKLICSKCGDPLWRHQSNNYYSWYCSKKMSRGKAACEGVSISQKKIDKIYTALGDNVEVHREPIKQSLLDWLKELKVRLSADSNYENYEKERDRLKAEEERLVDLYLENKISPDLYNRKYDDLQKKIGELQEKFIPIEDNEDLKEVQAVIDNIDAEIDKYLESQELEKEKIGFLTEHTKKVTVYPDKIIVIELDLIAGAIIGGKDFMLYVSESMQIADGRVCA